MSGAHAVVLLSKLLRIADRRSPGSPTPSIGIDYGDVGRSGADLEAFLGVLQDAERAGGASLVHGNHGQRHQVVRIRHGDLDKLAAFLGTRRAGPVADALLATIKAKLPEDAEPWVEDLLERCAARWRRADPAWKADPADAEGCLERFAILGALAAGVHPADQRSFSASLFKDRSTDGSKVFERHRGQVLLMLREVLTFPGSDDDLLASLGIVRFPPPVEIRGPAEVDFVAAGFSGGVLPCSLAPYVTVRSEWLGGLQWTGEPIRALLTIENKTSFERHVREVRQPDVCVVYTGGMPSAPVLRALGKLLASRPGLEVHHWGDFDIGGLRIMANLQRALGMEVRPHLMDAEMLEARGRVREPSVPKSLLADAGVIGEMARRLQGTGLMLEQERVDPRPIP